MTEPTLSVILLAGGHSQRMGTDKALLTMPNGEPLIARTLRVASQLTEDVVVVTGWCDRYQQQLKPLALPPTIRFVQEQNASGPLNGFAQGWAQIRADWCLLLACDLPYLAPQPVQQWWTWLIEYQASKQSMASLTPKLHSPNKTKCSSANMKRWEPLCGFYHRSCLQALTRHLHTTNSGSATRRQRSFQAWLTDIPITAYTAFPQAMLFNCNTPADWAVAQQTIF